MKNFKLSGLLILLFLSANKSEGQERIDSIIPIRGLSISVPEPNQVDSFITFINNELGPRKVNRIILRVDFNYRYKSHPELVDENALSNEQVKLMVKACKKNNIKIIPQINLLGHQSWANKTNKLLSIYPQFDETPQVKMPEKYEWPNADNLYCKSYCPLHPDVHKIVFDLIDEICTAFEADAFHAGMDEVFYIGDDKCPRCSGRDKAELFAGEIKNLRDHLAQDKRELWIWGDRLIDGKTTGLGMWEASFNNTYRAIDLIPKDVFICDWHYERSDKTAVYFAMKGFRVVTCPWRNPQIAIEQVNDMVDFRRQSTKEMKERFQGVVETVWSSVGGFLNGYYSKQTSSSSTANQTPWRCFQAMYKQIQLLSEPK